MPDLEIKQDMSGWSRIPGGGLREPKLVRAKVELTKRELIVHF